MPSTDDAVDDTAVITLDMVNNQSESYKLFNRALGYYNQNLWCKVPQEVEPPRDSRVQVSRDSRAQVSRDTMKSKQFDVGDLEPRASVPIATPTHSESHGSHLTPGSFANLRPGSPLSILVPSIVGSMAVPAYERSGHTASQDNNTDNPAASQSSLTNGHIAGGGSESEKTEMKSPHAVKENGCDPSLPPNTPLSPPPVPPNLLYYEGGFNPHYPLPHGAPDQFPAFEGYPYHGVPNAHSRQSSDASAGNPAPSGPAHSSPYYYPYIDPRYPQYPYFPYAHPLYPAMHVPAFYPTGYSPSGKRSRKPKVRAERSDSKAGSKERSAFRTVGRTSPNKRINHRSPEKMSVGSLSKSFCSNSTLSSKESNLNTSRSSRKTTSRKLLYPEYADLPPSGVPAAGTAAMTPPRSAKSSTSSSAPSERQRRCCLRDDRRPSGRSSRSGSVQNRDHINTGISRKALKLLTMQKRQLDHLQQQVSLLMKNAHNSASAACPSHTSSVSNLDRSLESMREQMQQLELEIDQEVGSGKTNDVCVGTGDSLIMSRDTATNMTQVLPNSTVAADSGEEESFYIQLKENTDPQIESAYFNWLSSQSYRANSTLPCETSCSSSKYDLQSRDPTHVSTTIDANKYREYSIFQHPKIQPPALSTSMCNSMFFGTDESAIGTENNFAEGNSKVDFSIASRKYLEKHQLVSPPTRDKKKHTKG